MSFEQLKEQYPLGPLWSEPTLFAETAVINDVKIHLAGSCAENVRGQMATGSAGDLVESPVNRAYFELIERTSIVAMSDTERRSWETKDAHGAPGEQIPYDVLVPTSRDPERWRYAKSNGVAAGPSWEEACLWAEWELIERDRLLRSWYGAEAPVQTHLPLSAVPFGLQALYSFEAYLFIDNAMPNIAVAGVFGFPKEQQTPLLCGFGSRPTSAAALGHATNECIQRLGFLWGEEIPVREPEFSPTPDFHQEYFLRPCTHEQLHRWLDGDHQRLSHEFVQLSPLTTGDRRFVDITPPELKSKLFVSKAIPQSELTLVFGEGHPLIVGSRPEAVRIHPIS